jgi:glycosyltransferase involved in cell wall biosynthesis
MAETSKQPIDRNPVACPMRRVLLISYPFPPAASAGVLRTVRFVRYLREFGWEPMVLTVTPEPGSHPADGSLDGYLPSELTVHRTRLWNPEESLGALLRQMRRLVAPSKTSPSGSANGLGREAGAASGMEAGHGSSQGDLAAARGGVRAYAESLRQIMFQTPDSKIWWAMPTLPQAVRLVKQWKPDVILATAPPHSSLLLATMLGRWTRTPFVLDFRDPWSRSPWTHSRQTVAQRVAPRLERACIRRADAVLLNTERTTEEFRKFYGEPLASRFMTLPNGFDPALLDELPPTPLRQDANAPLRLLHPGAIYGKRDLRPLLEAIRRFARQGGQVNFEQVGIIRQSYDVSAYLAASELEEHVTLSGVLSHEGTLARMAEADVLVVIQPGTPLQVPGKLYEMLMFGKPILALAGEGETADLVRRYDLGVVADPECAESIEAAIRKLLGDRGPKEFVGRQQEARKHFDGRNLTGRLASILDDVASRHRRMCACQPMTRADGTVASPPPGEFSRANPSK